MNLWLRMPFEYTKLNSFLQRFRKRFTFNRLAPTEIHRFQLGVESGSGPGGRWFKSIRPDHFNPVKSIS